MTRFQGRNAVVPLASLVLCAIFAAQAHSSSSSPASSKPIVIGAAIAQSGFMSAYDGPPAAAVQIAIKQINAQGGVLGRKLQYVSSDTKSQVAEGSTAAASVLGRHADVVISSCDFDLGAGAAQAAQRANKLALSLCAGSLDFGPRGIGQNAFTFNNAAESASSAEAEWAYKKAGMRTAYILVAPAQTFHVELCNAFETRWKQLGGKIVGNDTLAATDTNFSPQITHITALSTQPDLLFTCDPEPQVFTLLKQARSAGVKSAFFGDPGLDGNSWKSAVPDATNVYFPAVASIFGDDTNPKVNAFVKLFTKTTHHAPPNAYAISGYSLVQALVFAIKKTHGNLQGSALAKALENTNLPLLMGTTRFSTKYHIPLHNAISIMKVTNGETHLVTKWAPKVVPLPKGY